MCSENKKVFLYGYFGAGNYGDELILIAFLKHYLKHENNRFGPPPGVIVPVNIENNPFLEILKNEFKNQDVIFVKRSKNPFSISNIKLIKKSECLIFPGGGIFQDYGKLSFFCYFMFAAMAKMLRKKVFLLYQGFTGVKKTFFKKMTLFLTSNMCDYISIRDAGSLKYINNNATENSGIFSDAVFLLNDEVKKMLELEKKEMKNEDSCQEKSNNIIGISLRTWPGMNEYSLAFVIKKIIESTDFKVRLYSMQKNEDGALNTKIYEVFKNAGLLEGVLDQKVEICDFEPDYRRFIKLISANYINIGMRFHFSVLSIMAGVPSLGLSYDDKILKLYQELKLSEICVNVGDIGNTPHGAAACRDEKIRKISDEVTLKLKLIIRNYDKISRNFNEYSRKKACDAEILFEEFIKMM